MGVYSKPIPEVRCALTLPRWRELLFQSSNLMRCGEGSRGVIGVLRAVGAVFHAADRVGEVARGFLGRFRVGNCLPPSSDELIPSTVAFPRFPRLDGARIEFI